MVFKERTFYGKAPEEMLPQTPAALETHVADCLATVDGLDASDIGVVSTGDTIVLTGTVMTSREIGRAEEAARSIKGVARVINRIVATTDLRSPSASS